MGGSFGGALAIGARLFEVACTVTVIRNTELRNVRVPIPSIKDQQVIGRTLTACDVLIENNLRRMGLLEKAAR